MDIRDTTSREFFRPLATLVAPGATALAPYVLLVLHYNPDLIGFWNQNAGSILLILSVFAVSAGLVLEDVGAHIESKCWDRVLDTDGGAHIRTWWAYLKLVYPPTAEPIGQHYLRTVVVRLKFQLGFSLALLLAWPGLLWLHLVTARFSTCFFVSGSLIWLGTAVFVLWQSFESARTLGYVRSILVDGQVPVEAPARAGK